METDDEEEEIVPIDDDLARNLAEEYTVMIAEQTRDAFKSDFEEYFQGKLQQIKHNKMQLRRQLALLGQYHLSPIDIAWNYVVLYNQKIRKLWNECTHENADERGRVMRQIDDLNCKRRQRLEEVNELPDCPVQTWDFTGWVDPRDRNRKARSTEKPKPVNKPKTVKLPKTIEKPQTIEKPKVVASQDLLTHSASILEGDYGVSTEDPFSMHSFEAEGTSFFEAEFEALDFSKKYESQLASSGTSLLEDPTISAAEEQEQQQFSAPTEQPPAIEHQIESSDDTNVYDSLFSDPEGGDQLEPDLASPQTTEELQTSEHAADVSPIGQHVYLEEQVVENNDLNSLFGDCEEDNQLETALGCSQTTEEPQISDHAADAAPVKEHVSPEAQVVENNDFGSLFSDDEEDEQTEPAPASFQATKEAQISEVAAKPSTLTQPTVQEQVIQGNIGNDASLVSSVVQEVDLEIASAPCQITDEPQSISNTGSEANIFPGTTADGQSSEHFVGDAVRNADPAASQQALAPPEQVPVVSNESNFGAADEDGLWDGPWLPVEGDYFSQQMLAEEMSGPMPLSRSGEEYGEMFRQSLLVAPSTQVFEQNLDLFPNALPNQEVDAVPEQSSEVLPDQRLRADHQVADHLAPKAQAAPDAALVKTVVISAQEGEGLGADSQIAEQIAQENQTAPDATPVEQVAVSTQQGQVVAGKSKDATYDATQEYLDASDWRSSAPWNTMPKRPTYEELLPNLQEPVLQGELQKLFAAAWEKLGPFIRSWESCSLKQFHMFALAKDEFQAQELKKYESVFKAGGQYVVQFADEFSEIPVGKKTEVVDNGHSVFNCLVPQLPAQDATQRKSAAVIDLTEDDAPSLNTAVPHRVPRPALLAPAEIVASIETDPPAASKASNAKGPSTPKRPAAKKKKATSPIKNNVPEIDLQAPVDEGTFAGVSATPISSTETATPVQGDGDDDEIWQNGWSDQTFSNSEPSPNSPSDQELASMKYSVASDNVSRGLATSQSPAQKPTGAATGSLSSVQERHSALNHQLSQNPQVAGNIPATPAAAPGPVAGPSNAAQPVQQEPARPGKRHVGRPHKDQSELASPRKHKLKHPDSPCAAPTKRSYKRRKQNAKADDDEDDVPPGQQQGTPEKPEEYYEAAPNRSLSLETSPKDYVKNIAEGTKGRKRKAPAPKKTPAPRKAQKTKQSTADAVAPQPGDGETVSGTPEPRRYRPIAPAPARDQDEASGVQVQQPASTPARGMDGIEPLPNAQIAGNEPHMHSAAPYAQNGQPHAAQQMHQQDFPQVQQQGFQPMAQHDYQQMQQHGYQYPMDHQQGFHHMPQNGQQYPMDHQQGFQYMPQYHHHMGRPMGFGQPMQQQGVGQPSYDDLAEEAREAEELRAKQAKRRMERQSQQMRQQNYQHHRAPSQMAPSQPMPAPGVASYPMNMHQGYQQAAPSVAYPPRMAPNQNGYPAPMAPNRNGYPAPMAPNQNGYPAPMSSSQNGYPAPMGFPQNGQHTNI